MCGIAGFIDFNRTSTSETLKSMTDELHHRGPDDSGCELFTGELATIGFGFRRLAIIDLSSGGHQPMTVPERDKWIIFNGEIYNYREIKAELIALGHKFISESDTEVILHSYEEWGINCLSRFIGMFGFALYDLEKAKVFIARDRAGIKPVYYYQTPKLFLFGSELKAFHKHPLFTKEINKAALPDFFRHGYIPAPATIFKNTYKLPQGNYLEIDLRTGKSGLHKYWDVFDFYNKPTLKISFDDALEQTESILKSAFKYRMIADVPLGVFLSGGYDSSCVAALLQGNSSHKIKTYTIGFADQKYNEATYSSAVAEYLGTEHHEYYCTEKEAMDIIPVLPQIYDEPFGDQSAIPTTLVCREARKHVTVALSADGGDELFAGYPRHLKSLSMINKRHKLPAFIAKAIGGVLPDGSIEDLSSPDRRGKLKSLLNSTNFIDNFRTVNDSYNSREIRELLKVEETGTAEVFNSTGNLLSDILAYEYKHYLADDILHKVDRASMSTSLEGREPFLDHRIVEFVAQLPDEYKMQNGRQKILLKEIVHKYLPVALMERPKMGFGIPLDSWFRSDLKDLFYEVMDFEKMERQNLFHVGKVRKMVDAYMDGKLENFQRLWLIFVFQQWYNRWMD
ncbi:MAG: asparagine synthase (glutamine-hydrolyzing) [Bacteroidetes bacterium]|nr:asparagine synthase (glutamine-hydrolyzing) [Bacteroidota bacterium]